MSDDNNKKLDKMLKDAQKKIANSKALADAAKDQAETAKEQAIDAYRQAIRSETMLSELKDALMRAERRSADAMRLQQDRCILASEVVAWRKWYDSSSLTITESAALQWVLKQRAMTDKNDVLFWAGMPQRSDISESVERSKKAN